ncbi:hypothetical protein GC194_00960 [bacterium]|nr:hypothetical protein [bacterium]
MSSKQKFNTLLSPGFSAFEKEDIEFLREILARFPYFQTARLLLARALYHTESLQFKDELSKLALQTTHRELLFELFGKAPVAQSAPPPPLESYEIPALNFKVSGPIESASADSPVFSDEQEISYETGPAFNLEKFYGESSVPPKKSRSLELIEGFLSKAQQIDKRYIPRQEQPQADNSLEDTGDLASETLAKIYIKQEKFGAAIKVYEKLMLLKPEKKQKFAGLIEELKLKEQ